MKKISLRLVSVIMAGALLAGGCGAKQQTDAVASTEASTEAASLISDETMKAALDFKASDYVTLGDYKGIEVEYVTPEVTEEEVNDAVDEALSEATEYKDVNDREVKKGDNVNIDYKGTIDGKEFDGGSAEDTEFIVGDGNFLEDFENGVLGMKTGDKKDVKVVFPEDYGEESLNGKEANFEITLNSIQEVVVPTFDDAFVKANSDCQTTEEFKEMKRQELMDSAIEDATSETSYELLTKVVENATIDGYPQALYDECYNETMESYKSYAQMFGMSVEEFMSQYASEDDIKESAIEWVNEILVIQAIADAEELNLSDEEYEERCKEVADNEGYTSAEEMIEQYGVFTVNTNLIRERVLSFLNDNAKIREISAEEYEEEAEEVEETTEG